MPVHLTVAHKSDATLKGEATYHEETITIGRDRTNVLHLSDESKTVSRYHARIQQKNGHFSITDCESRNATFLNKKKVEPGAPAALNDGDRIQIGDFNLVITLMPDAAAPAEEDYTVALENPFKEDVAAFKALFSRLQSKYAEQPESMRAGLLSDALDNQFSNTPTGDVGNAIADRLASITGREKGEASQPITYSQPQQGRMAGVLDILISSILELMTIVHDFRRDMVNITVIKTEDTIYGMSNQKLKSYLLDERLSETAAHRRSHNLKEQVDEIILHHRAMQAGYKSAIKEGPQRLLDVLDPEQIENRFRNDTIGIGPIQIPTRWIPLVNKLKVYKAMKEMSREILAEGQVANDRHLLRPLFINTYMERMTGTSSRTGDSAPF